MVKTLDSAPEDPGKSCGTKPRDEASPLGDGEPERLPSDVKELQSPESITAINSTVPDSPLSLCESTRTEDTPAHEKTPVHQPDALSSLTHPQLLNHNANNIRCMDDDDSAPVNATDPLNAHTDPRASSECDENKDTCVGDPLQSSNESSGNGVETHDDVDGTTQAPPTPPVGPAHQKPENKKHFFQRNKKSSNEGNLFMCVIKLVCFSTAA